MIHNCETKRISVVQIGKLNTTIAYRAILNVNKFQKAFQFELLKNVKLPLDSSFKLANGGYNISEAARELLKTKKYKDLPRPIILLTDNPLGELEYADEPGYFFFFSREDDWDSDVTIISTQPLETLPKTRSYEDYLLMMLSTYIFSNFMDLDFHEDTRGCFLDYCDELSDAEKAFQIGNLCFECEQELQKRLYTNNITVEEVAAVKRLMNKAIHRKKCFVAMPINDDFKDVYKTIKESLTEIGWVVFRADEITFPRLITRKILLEIMSADLVLVDLTNNNPNVFFELGMSHMVSHDILMITQEDSIPFDIKNEQTIFYKKDNLDLLKNNLKKLCK